jgi:hypothetical protein
VEDRRDAPGVHAAEARCQGAEGSLGTVSMEVKIKTCFNKGLVLFPFDYL